MIRQQQGWILVDSLLGMVVLSIALLAFLTAFYQGTRSTVMSNGQTVASYVAQDALMALKVYDGKKQARDSKVWQSSGTHQDANTQAVYAYQTAVLEPAEIPADLRASIIPVRVTVIWQELNEAKHYQMITYYYQ